MKLYVQTPRYHDNKYLPHLVEHCVLYSDDLRSFLPLQEVDGSTYTWYTVFEFERAIKDLVLSQIFTPLSEESFLKERKSVQQELKEASFEQKEYVKLLQKITKNPTLQGNKIDGMVCFSDVQQYHTQYYVQWRKILVDDNGEIVDVYQWDMDSCWLSELKTFEQYQGMKMSYQKEKSYHLFVKYQTPEDILFLVFFSRILEYYSFRESQKRGKRVSDLFRNSFTDQYYIISRRKSLPPFPWQEFFVSFKEYFQKYHDLWYKILPLIALFLHKHVEQDDLQKWLSDLSYEKLSQFYRYVKTL